MTNNFKPNKGGYRQPQLSTEEWKAKKQAEKDAVYQMIDDAATAIVQDGDEIEIDVDNGKLELRVSDEEIAERFKTWKRPDKPIPNGYLRLYARVAASADKGAVIMPENLDK